MAEALYKRRQLLVVPQFADQTVGSGLVQLLTAAVPFLSTVGNGGASPADWRPGARFSMKLISGQLIISAPADVSLESATLQLGYKPGSNPMVPLYSKPLTFGAITALASGMSFESTPIELDYEKILMGGGGPIGNPVLPYPWLVWLSFYVNNSGADTSAGFTQGWLQHEYELYGGANTAGN